MSNKLKMRILSVFLIILLCFGFTIKEFQNDTFYIIKLGSDIFEHGFNLVDYHCWVADLQYTYPHFLYDIFLYLIYDSFGNFGVYMTTVIFFILLILCIYFINLKINKNDFMAFFVAIISIMSFVIFVTARSQLLSYIILIFEVYFIENLIKKGKKRYVFYLAILSLLLANVHATIWLFYFVLFLPFIGEHIIALIVSKLNLKVNKKLIINKMSNFKMLMFSFGISFVMGIFSFSRICYTYVIKIMLGNSQSLIDEHLPLIVINHPLFIGLVSLMILVLVFTNVKIKLKELFMIGGLILMSLISGRHVALFYLIGILYISIICIRCLDLKKDRTLDILLNIVVNNKIVYIAIILIAFFVSFINFNNNFKDNYINPKYYPVSAVKYIKSNIDLDDFRVYNGYNYGSYMLFNDIPVFIDSRCDLYLNEFNNVNIFNDSADISNNYSKIFNKYNVNYVLINNDSILYKLLCLDNNYIEEYSDKYFTLFKLSES